MTNGAAATAAVLPRFRVRVFIDFWNFTLSVRNHDANFRVAWQKLGNVLSVEACKLIDPNSTAHYEGMQVYGSYDPNKPDDAKLRHWLTNTLDKMAGVNVITSERQRKRGYPKCPHCQTEAVSCQACQKDMRGTEEKGVDTRIATDMISQAWSDGYNVAVLVTADRDFIPVVEFLHTKGIKVIHGAFPPSGSFLSQKCWGNLPIPQMMNTFQR